MCNLTGPLCWILGRSVLSAVPPDRLRLCEAWHSARPRTYRMAAGWSPGSAKQAAFVKMQRPGLTAAVGVIMHVTEAKQSSK